MLKYFLRGRAITYIILRILHELWKNDFVYIVADLPFLTMVKNILAEIIPLSIQIMKFLVDMLIVVNIQDPVYLPVEYCLWLSAP